MLTPMSLHPSLTTLFPYTTLFRSRVVTRLEPTQARRQSTRGRAEATDGPDRKSTRLNSSHVEISYAVFCLKKKNYEYFALKWREAKNDRESNSVRSEEHTSELQSL